MLKKSWIVSVLFVSLSVFAWVYTIHAAEETAASSEVANGVGSALLKAYVFVPVHPNPPNHVWLDEGNGRVQFMMFDKAVNDPSAKLLFIGQGVKGTFCAESQPDGGKSGFNHFHRTNTPATGDTSMHGAKGEEGYWLKHVAVAEFDDDPKGEHAGHGGKTHYKPGQVENMPQPTTPRCK
jgi:hypothetical protein